MNDVIDKTKYWLFSIRRISVLIPASWYSGAHTPADTQQCETIKAYIGMRDDKKLNHAAW